VTKVVVPSQLHGYTAGKSEVEAGGSTVADVLADLDRQFPGFRFRVRA
jgi:sulfur-carrier protein